MNKKLIYTSILVLLTSCSGKTSTTTEALNTENSTDSISIQVESKENDDSIEEVKNAFYNYSQIPYIHKETTTATYCNVNILTRYIRDEVSLTSQIRRKYGYEIKLSSLDDVTSTIRTDYDIYYTTSSIYTKNELGDYVLETNQNNKIELKEISFNFSKIDELEIENDDYYYLIKGKVLTTNIQAFFNDKNDYSNIINLSFNCSMNSNLVIDNITLNYQLDTEIIVNRSLTYEYIEPSLSVENL